MSSTCYSLFSSSWCYSAAVRCKTWFYLFLEFCIREGKSSQRLSFFLEVFAWVLVFSADGVKKACLIAVLSIFLRRVVTRRLMQRNAVHVHFLFQLQSKIAIRRNVWSISAGGGTFSTASTATVRGVGETNQFTSERELEMSEGSSSYVPHFPPSSSSRPAPSGYVVNGGDTEPPSPSSYQPHVNSLRPQTPTSTTSGFSQVIS